MALITTGLAVAGLGMQVYDRYKANKEAEILDRQQQRESRLLEHNMLNTRYQDSRFPSRGVRTAYYARGGRVGVPQFEVEGGEVVEGNIAVNGGSRLAPGVTKVNGASHANGGVDGAGEGIVYNDRLPLSEDMHIMIKSQFPQFKGKTHADAKEFLAKKRGKKGLGDNVDYVKANTLEENTKILGSLEQMLEDEQLQIQQQEQGIDKGTMKFPYGGKTGSRLSAMFKKGGKTSYATGGLTKEDIEAMGAIGVDANGNLVYPDTIPVGDAGASIAGGPTSRRGFNNASVRNPVTGGTMETRLNPNRSFTPRGRTTSPRGSRSVLDPVTGETKTILTPRDAAGRSIIPSTPTTGGGARKIADPRDKSAVTPLAIRGVQTREKTIDDYELSQRGKNRDVANPITDAQTTTANEGVELGKATLGDKIRGGKLGGLGSASDIIGQGANLAQYLMNRKDIKGIDTSRPVMTEDRKPYRPTDRSGVLLDRNNQSMRNASETLRLSGKATMPRLQQLFAQKLAADGNVRTQERARLDQIGASEAVAGDARTARNVRSINQERDDRLQNEFTKTRLGMNNRSAFVQGIIGNLEQSQLRQLDMDKLSIILDRYDASGVGDRWLEELAIDDPELYKKVRDAQK